MSGAGPFEVPRGVLLPDAEIIALRAELKKFVAEAAALRQTAKDLKRDEFAHQLSNLEQLARSLARTVLRFVGRENSSDG